MSKLALTLPKDRTVRERERARESYRYIHSCFSNTVCTQHVYIIPALSLWALRVVVVQYLLSVSGIASRRPRLKPRAEYLFSRLVACLWQCRFMTACIVLSVRSCGAACIVLSARSCGALFGSSQGWGRWGGGCLFFGCQVWIAGL